MSAFMASVGSRAGGCGRRCVSIHTQSSCSMPCSAAVAGLMSIVRNMCASPRIHGLLRYSLVCGRTRGCDRQIRCRVLIRQVGTRRFMMGGSMYIGRRVSRTATGSSLHSSILPLSDCGCAGTSVPSSSLCARRAIDRAILLPHRAEAGLHVALLRIMPLLYFGILHRPLISRRSREMRSRNLSST